MESLRILWSGCCSAGGLDFRSGAKAIFIMDEMHNFHKGDMVGFLDLDNFSYLWDNFSLRALGDKIIKILVKSFIEEGFEIYRVYPKGDEFVVTIHGDNHAWVNGINATSRRFASYQSKIEITSIIKFTIGVSDLINHPLCWYKFSDASNQCSSLKRRGYKGYVVINNDNPIEIKFL